MRLWGVPFQFRFLCFLEFALFTALRFFTNISYFATGQTKYDRFYHHVNSVFHNFQFVHFSVLTISNDFLVYDLLINSSSLMAPFGCLLAPCGSLLAIVLWMFQYFATPTGPMSPQMA